MSLILATSELRPTPAQDFQFSEFSRADNLTQRTEASREISDLIQKISQRAGADLVGNAADAVYKGALGEIDRHDIWFDPNVYVWTSDDEVYFQGGEKGEVAFQRFCEHMLVHAVYDLGPSDEDEGEATAIEPRTYAAKRGIILDYNSDSPLQLVNHANPVTGQPYQLITGLAIFRSAGPDYNDVARLTCIQYADMPESEKRVHGIRSTMRSSKSTKEELVRQMFLLNQLWQRGEFFRDSAPFPTTSEEMAIFANMDEEYVKDIFQTYDVEGVFRLICERQLAIGNAIAVVKSLRNQDDLLDEAMQYLAGKSLKRKELLVYLKDLKARINLPPSEVRRRALRAFTSFYNKGTSLLETHGRTLATLLSPPDLEELTALEEQIFAILQRADGKVQDEEQEQAGVQNLPRQRDQSQPRLKAS